MAKQDRAEIDYCNWRGERRKRLIEPICVWYGATEWQPEKQWWLRAYCVESGAWRDFSMTGLHGWTSAELGAK